MHATRPDISFTVIRLSQFAARPLTDHWLALKRVLRYIKGTLDAKLTFGGSAIPHLVYSLCERMCLDTVCRKRDGSRYFNPVQLYGDNQGANALTRNPEHHQRTKHIDVRQPLLPP